MSRVSIYWSCNVRAKTSLSRWLSALQFIFTLINKISEKACRARENFGATMCEPQGIQLVWCPESLNDFLL